MDTYLDYAQVAALSGVSAATLRSYYSRGLLPSPDLKIGQSPGWREETIRAWLASRSGRGAGGGRRPTDVYFVQSGESGPIKIGVAVDVAARIAVLQTATPTPLELLGVVPRGGRELERLLHKELAEDRLTGEWFWPSEKVQARLATLLSGL